MNCRKCKFLGEQVLSNNSEGKPFKYYCIKNRFPTINSKNKNGKSKNFENKEYYTQKQLENYINKGTVCLIKYDLNLSNIIASLALLFSIIALNKCSTDENRDINFNKNQLIIIDNLVKKSISTHLDSITKKNNIQKSLLNKKTEIKK